MNTSDSIESLAKALSIAQGQMTGAKKAAKNPFFKSKYSDLAHVIEAISKPFAENGLSYVQVPGFDGQMITVTTRIMHLSGEWIEGVTALPPTKNDAQGYGSAITYGRRYGLQAMTGVPSVDDDGQDAVKHKEEKPSTSFEISNWIASAKTRDDLTKIWKQINSDQHKEFEADFKARMNQLTNTEKAS